MVVSEKSVLSNMEVNAARVLIAFYFIAVAAGYADGVSLVPVFDTFLPAQVAGWTSVGVLFLMGFLVLLGIFLRGVALIMAGFLLASYVLTAVKTGDWHAPRTIWRDIALIGALILTYAQREGFFTRRPAPVGKNAPVEDKPKGGLSKAEQNALLSQVPGYEVKGLYVKSKTPRPKPIEDLMRDSKSSN